MSAMFPPPPIMKRFISNRTELDTTIIKNVEEQCKFRVKSRMSRIDPIIVKKFEDKFKLPFTHVINIADIGGILYDDENDHYINLSAMDVYTYDNGNYLWLEKYIYKQEILPNVNWGPYEIV
jgi:hypothetical protein